MLFHIPLLDPPSFRIFLAVGEVGLCFKFIYSLFDFQFPFFLCAVYLIFELLYLSPPFSAGFAHQHSHINTHHQKLRSIGLQAIDINTYKHNFFSSMATTKKTDSGVEILLHNLSHSDLVLECSSSHLIESSMFYYITI